jgi:hypothetical protein
MYGHYFTTMYGHYFTTMYGHYFTTMYDLVWREILNYIFMCHQWKSVSNAVLT